MLKVAILVLQMFTFKGAPTFSWLLFVLFVSGVLGVRHLPQYVYECFFTHTTATFYESS